MPPDTPLADKQPQDVGSDAYDRLSPREEDAARAQSAIIGLFLCPLQIYTLWLLVLVAMDDERLRPRYFWYAVAAAAILVPDVVVTVALFPLVFAN